MTPDFSTFESRLHLCGTLTFTSAMRIGAEKSLAVDTPDTPVLRDATGMPYIPGSSFKGALRSYVEAVARAIQSRDDVEDRNLACIPIGRPPARPQDDSVCLYQDEVTALKSVKPDSWHTSDQIPKVLARRLPSAEDIQSQIQKEGKTPVLDRALRDLSCWTCRLFGAQWLASKVLIKDLYVDEASFLRTEIRDGVGIDRDAGRAATGIKYQFEIVPANTKFDLEVLVENATEAELGLLWLGLGAFERGEIPIGGAKSRGLGWCRWRPDWEQSRYIGQSNLIAMLLPDETNKTQSMNLEERPKAWLEAFAEAIGLKKGGENA